MMTLHDLPNEMLVEIFSFFNLIERQRLERVCKRWQCIVEQMFNIRALQFFCANGESNQSRISAIIKNRVLFICCDISQLPRILRKFNGNLKRLEFASASSITHVSDEICQLIRRNEYLESVRIDGINGEAVKILNYLCPEHLRNLNIEISYEEIRSSGHELALKHILDAADKLTFVSLNNPPQSILDRISEVHTLKSLCIRFENNVLSEFKIGQLSNLEIISFPGSGQFHKNFWRDLVENCTKLNTIEFSDSSRMSHTVLTALASLPNLRFVKLTLPINTKVLDYFSNLEEIYCTTGNRPVQEIRNFLQRSPNLKRFYFFYEDHLLDVGNMKTFQVNERFWRIAMELSMNIDMKKPMIISYIEWKKIFLST